MEKRHWTSYKYGVDSLHNNIQLREIVLRSLFLFCCRACIYHSGHTRLLLFSSGRTLSNKADSEGYYDIPSRCITKHPSFLRSDVLLLQPYSVYSADKLNNFKGQHEGQGSLPLPLQTLSSEIITEPFNAVWWAASRSASCRLHRQRKSTFRNCDFKVLHPRQLSDGIKQDWKPNKCLEETGSSCSEGHRF